MKFSTQEEYGLRCLLQIARSTNKNGMTIPQISQAEGLSEANVAKMLRILRMGGIIESARGHEGGYRLARTADQIRIGDVLTVLGGRLFDHEFCEKHAGEENICSHGTDCTLRHVWQTVQTAVDDVLMRLTLQDLVHPAQKPITEIKIPSTLVSTT
ncbi:Rrf2 family transcriptional regulator [bacterium]|nr:Rrf2 family transcriptional regulator [bacterium]NUN44300.1 Rrf2 family transcriptional regulator [bacterium]HMV26939.1 Rrf2 family transcriptional regulator [bacterium]HMW36483.1 Rrf2 family transcriptional regulator [bacterium]HMY36435.1 Rrf2 family transcriptional regulator [bacterium]